jgi:hypothetical protein
VIDFEPEVPPLLYLVVTNLGRTMARNVRFEVDPPFRSSQDERWGCRSGRSSCSPPAPRRWLLGNATSPPSIPLFNREELGLPSSYWVRISYDGKDGQSFTDEQRLDLDLYRGLRPVHRDTIHHVSETLMKIEQRMTG